MARNRRGSGKWLLGATGIGSAVLVVALLLPAWVRAAVPDLPPRPSTPTPAPKPTARARPDTGPHGAHIELHVRFGDRETAAQWQAVWTVVQWQDGQGNWHDVEGWRGALDTMRADVGYKTWWLAEDLFGRGPFRWSVASEEGSPSLASSEPFYLPPAAGERTRVQVLLAP